MKNKLSVAAFVLCLLSGAAHTANADGGMDDIYKIIQNEDIAAFSEMTAFGYDIDEQDMDGYTPLMTAAALGKVNFVEYLIDNGANVNKRYYLGGTALHRAALGGFNDIVTLLLDSGVQINMPDLDGMTALMTAVKAGKRFTVELLAKRGANLNYRNAEGMTALDLANKYRHKEIAQFLIESGGKTAPAPKPKAPEDEPTLEELLSEDDGLGWDTFYK